MLFGLLAAAAERPVAGQLAPRLTRYTVEDGLAQTRAHAIAQDSHGFLWIGGPRGLQRFDGHTFVSYRELDPAAPAELSGNILRLQADPLGRLWVQTPEALWRVDPLTRNADRVPLPGAGAWAPDSTGRIWLLERSVLSWIAMDSSRLIAHPVRTGVPFTDCAAIATTQAGSLWLVGCREQRGAIRFQPTGALQLLASTVGEIGVLEDAAGKVWLYGSNGLAFCDPGCSSWRSVGPMRGRAITALAAAPQSGVWAMTREELVRIDSAGAVQERWAPAELFGSGGLPATLSRDHEGGYWITTLAQGIARLDFQRRRFEHRAKESDLSLALSTDFITALFERDDGTLWVGTLGGGAYRISSDWSKLQAFRHDARDPHSLAGDEVWAFEEDLQGALWIGVKGSLCRVLPAGFRCHTTGNAVADIARDKEGRFWLALEGGGVRSFDPATERFGAPVPGLPLGASYFGAITLATDADSATLWIGNDGLLRSRLTPEGASRAEPVHFGPRFSAVYAVHRDRRGRLWIGADEGLLTQDAATGAWHPVSFPALLSTTVFSIAEDRRGRLWIGTAHGLVLFEPEAGTARRYGRVDGFLSGELNRRAALLRRNGRMLFGGVEGLTEFDPDVVAGAGPAPPIALTRWQKVTRAGPVAAPLAGDSVLRLEPGDRAVSFEFAGLSFAPSLGSRYRYRLSGLSPAWVETSQRAVTFGAPPPGHYRFEVQTAAGSQGEWSTPGAAVALEVIPAFWATTWFRGLLVLLLAGLLWAAHRWRMRHVLATERLRLRISRDLHDELGAGLSGIALLSDSAAGAGSETRTELRQIGESARDMVSDLRDIVWAIDPEADRLQDVVTRMRDVTSGLLHGVRVSFEAPPASELATRIGMGARRELLLLYKELLHNVAKHAHASEVRIALLLQRHTLELTVSDNGVGFSGNGVGAAAHGEIGAVGGGTGLKSMRERAERLGGELTLTSEPGQGTTARLVVRVT